MMNRKNAFTIMLFLWIILGIGASVMVFCSKPQEEVTAMAEQPEVKPVAEEKEPTPQMPEPEIAEAPEDIPEVSKPEEPQYTFTVVEISGRLRIRKEPSTDAEILDYMRAGESGEVIRIDEEWVLLKHGETEGYSFGKYLSLEEIPQEQ